MANRIINGIPFDANAIIDQEGEISYDYTLFAEDIASWLSTYFSNGILVPKAALMTTQFQVSKVDESCISINAGNIVINGRTGYLKSPHLMNISYASVGKQRIDRVVIELNTSETVNEFRPLILAGVDAEENPVEPSIVRDENLKIYQMSLAKILVTDSGIQNIIDERNDSGVCGVSQVLIGVKPAVPVTGDSALNISYDNSYTGAEEQTVQDALDSLYLNNKKKIMLDGVEYKGVLKMVSEFGWLGPMTLPYEFHYGTAVVLNGEIHILGSYRNADCLKHYKWNGLAWSEVSTLPYKSWYSSAVVLNNEIHILGGYDNTTGHYKWNGLAWVEVSTLPYNFVSSQAVVLNNEIHILGSSNGTYTKKHYKWDGSSWTRVSTLPYAFFYGSAVVQNNEIHILGGKQNTSDPTGRINHYKLDGSSWVEVTVLPYDFACGSAVVLDNVIYIIGGYDAMRKLSKNTKHIVGIEVA